MGKPPSLRGQHGHWKPQPSEGLKKKKLTKTRVTAHTVKGPKSIKKQKQLAKRIRNLQRDEAESSKAAAAKLANVMDLDEAKAIVKNEEEKAKKKGAK
jgi:hypothetical protein